jgi:hypothetical protein
MVTVIVMVDFMYVSDYFVTLYLFVIDSFHFILFSDISFNFKYRCIDKNQVVVHFHYSKGLCRIN